jgi:hypothetical protein
MRQAQNRTDPTDPDLEHCFMVGGSTGCSFGWLCRLSPLGVGWFNVLALCAALLAAPLAGFGCWLASQACSVGSAGSVGWLVLYRLALWLCLWLAP